MKNILIRRCTQQAVALMACFNEEYLKTDTKILTVFLICCGFPAVSATEPKRKGGRVMKTCLRLLRSFQHAMRSSQARADFLWDD